MTIINRNWGFYTFVFFVTVHRKKHDINEDGYRWIEAAYWLPAMVTSKRFQAMVAMMSIELRERDGEGNIRLEKCGV